MVNINICNGNPGALDFTLRAYAIDSMHAERAFQRMQDNNITGDKLYMIWNDCCDRNELKAIDVMIYCPMEFILEKLNYSRGRGIHITDEELLKFTKLKVDEIW